MALLPVKFTVPFWPTLIDAGAVTAMPPDRRDAAAPGCEPEADGTGGGSAANHQHRPTDFVADEHSGAITLRSGDADDHEPEQLVLPGGVA